MIKAIPITLAVVLTLVALFSTSASAEEPTYEIKMWSEVEKWANDEGVDAWDLCPHGTPSPLGWVQTMIWGMPACINVGAPKASAQLDRAGYTLRDTKQSDKSYLDIDCNTITGNPPTTLVYLLDEEPASAIQCEAPPPKWKQAFVVINWITEPIDCRTNRMYFHNNKCYVLHPSFGSAIADLDYISNNPTFVPHSTYNGCTWRQYVNGERCNLPEGTYIDGTNLMVPTQLVGLARVRLQSDAVGASAEPIIITKVEIREVEVTPEPKVYPTLNMFFIPRPDITTAYNNIMGVTNCGDTEDAVFFWREMCWLQWNELPTSAHFRWDDSGWKTYNETFKQVSMGTADNICIPDSDDIAGGIWVKSTTCLVTNYPDWAQIEVRLSIN